MKRTIGQLIVLSAVALMTGCVERRFVIESNPPSAQVLINGRPASFAPVDSSFVYYGEYDITLIKDGYETLHVREKVRTPWYQYFPIDFITENLIPWKITDVRRLRYNMQPLKPVRTENVLNRAQGLRDQGRLIGDQPYAPLPTPTPGPAPGPAGVPPMSPSPQR